MKERPILFNGAMVRAILAGTKTQTRRVVKTQPEAMSDDVQRVKGDDGFWWPATAARSMVQTREMPSFCPYGAPGDRLWVRETWCSAYARGCWGTVYGADEAFVQGPQAHPKGPHFNGDWKGPGPQVYRWKPSIHMPRWASRISLEVTEVRVQRLQDISEDDAQAEGVRPFFEVYDGIGRDQCITSGERAEDAPYRASYACLWDEINGDRALWSANPWVWAVSFRRVTP